MWNFISWTVVIVVVFCIFEADKLPAIKAWVKNCFKHKDTKSKTKKKEKYIDYKGE